jgi:hypothetical protein
MRRCPLKHNVVENREHALCLVPSQARPLGSESHRRQGMRHV